MYDQRLPLYLDFSDFAIENRGSPEKVAADILLNLNKR
jgi:hypothetical protein